MSLLFWVSIEAMGTAAVCQPGFTGGQKFSPGWNAGTSALADLNGDGVLDLTTGVSVLLGDGEGSFGEAVRLPRLSGAPFDVVPADFDKDGCIDLAVTYYAGEHDALGILYGQESRDPGDPLFEAPGAIPTVPKVWHLAVADFNEDEYPDIVAVGFPSMRSVGIHLYQGNRTFGSKPAGPICDSSGLFMTTGDFNGDTHQDIAVGINWKIGILFGRGNGTFHDSVNWELTVQGVPVTCHRCCAADLDRDGCSELLAIGETFVLMYRGSAISRETGGPKAPSVIFDLECTGRYLEVADMNGDGSLDVVAQGIRDRTVIQIFWGVSGFSEGTHFETGRPIYCDISGTGSVIAVGDVNRDEALDIVVIFEGAPQGQVLLNQGTCQSCTSCTAEPGDANGDGSVNMVDVVVMLCHVFHGTYLFCPGAANVNDDDQLNLADAVYLLAYLFVNGPPPPASGPQECAL